MRSESLRGLLDGYVALGDAQVPTDAKQLAAFGRVRFDDPVEVVADPEANGRTPAEAHDPTEEATVASPAREEDVAVVELAPAVPDVVLPDELEAKLNAPVAPPAGGFPRRLLAIGGGLVLVLLSGWWLSTRFSEPNGDGAPTNVALAEAAVEPPPPPPLDPADASRVFATAPQLPYSVLLASYATKDDADEDLTRLRAAGPGVFFISPTPVRGVLYHRLFAGALANEDEAVVLMNQLVADGNKDQASAWDVRPARSAFDLGVFVDRAAADARVFGLEAKGVPSYVVAAPMDDRDVFQVYAGAYENERASLPMAELLGAAGEAAALVARQGGANRGSSTP